MDLGIVKARELLAFPKGDNSSDTLIENVHYNLTTLEHWNYTYYNNGTVSNGSRCYLLFSPYTPHLLQNGTFLNNTSCYSPIKALGMRSIMGLVYACLFALSIVLTFINLRKHGKLFLPTEKRFRAIGRRWQWYWMLVVGAFAIISGITNVDVDRYYLPELPIILSNFFWFLSLPATLAAVWESVRHWGSWQERQVVDPNPFSLRQDDRRSKVEFYLPLVFYFCFWMNFFMVVPRSWGSIEKQRDPIQANNYAKPVATDIRFKLAALFLFMGWLTMVYSLQHSIKHYKTQNHGLLNLVTGFIKYAPSKILIVLFLSLVMIGYNAACAFDFSISPLNVETRLGYFYGLGWGSIICILFIYEFAGYLDPNEDRELIRQRRLRGAEIDSEMGITKKPHWWSRLHHENNDMSMQSRIARNVSEIGGGAATTKKIERSIEMGNMPVSRKQDDNRPGREDLETVRAASKLLFPASTTTDATSSYSDHPRDRQRRDDVSATSRAPMPGMGDRRDSGMSTSGPPQQVRSMLDV